MSDHPKTGQDKENVSVNGSQANPHIKSFRIVSRNRQNNIHSIDYSKNLEFSLFPQHVSHAPVSLAHIRPDLQNITPQKIALKDCNPNIYYTQRAPEYFLKTSKEAQAQRQIPVSDSQVFSSETESIRLYKLWPGKNRFFLGGRLMGGPKTDRIANISTWALILAISIIFFAVAFPYLLEDVTLLLPLISIYLFLSTISFFLLTTFTDPGIIPRKSIISLDNELRSFKYSNNKEKEDLETNSPLDSPKLEPKPNLSSNNNNLKFCHDCNIYKPPKTIHCKYCGNCVSLQYKHFHFVNNCIGRRNYRYFIGFMMSLLLLIVCYLTSFLIIIVTAIDPDSDPRSFFQDTDVTIIVILILGIPVAIKIVVILVFLIINLVSILKSRKLTKQQKVEKLALNIETGKVSVNLWATDISLVHPRKLVTKDQYSNFKKQNAEKL